MSENLAIKYRPRVFGEVIGQDPICAILEEEIKENKLGSAYLFCGTSGVGKTTCARIFAHSLGVDDPVEINASDHNGVDDIRGIIERMGYMPLKGTRRVLIIDEVQSMTPQAWNAFLKTLEEPPVNTIFILCTTEPGKILNTVLTRVQRFDFQRVDDSLICAHLKEVAAKENRGDYLDDDVYATIAKSSNGSVRASLSALDKVLSSPLAHITNDDAIHILGIPDYLTIARLWSALLYADIQWNTALDILRKDDERRTLRQLLVFANDVVKFDLTGNVKYTSLPDTERWKKDLSGLKADIPLKDALGVLKEVSHLVVLTRGMDAPESLIEASLALIRAKYAA